MQTIQAMQAACGPGDRVPVTAEPGMEPSGYPARIVAEAIDQDLDMDAAA
jgi:hypothetical protein